jgi:hypothetical protein
MYYYYYYYYYINNKVLTIIHGFELNTIFSTSAFVSGYIVSWIIFLIVFLAGITAFGLMQLIYSLKSSFSNKDKV